MVHLCENTHLEPLFWKVSGVSVMGGALNLNLILAQNYKKSLCIKFRGSFRDFDIQQPWWVILMMSLMMSQLLNLQMLQPPVPCLTSARVCVCVCVGSGQGGIVVSERVRSSAPLTPHCWETRKGAEWNLPSATSLRDSNTVEPNALADTVVYSAYKPHLSAVVLPFTGF